MVRVVAGQWGFSRPSSIYFSLGVVRDIVPLFIEAIAQIGKCDSANKKEMPEQSRSKLGWAWISEPNLGKLSC